MSADVRGWTMAPLKDYLLRIEAGRSPDVPDVPAAPGSWGVLKVSAVHSSGYRPSENKAVNNLSLVSSRYEIHPGDLLFSRANTPELVGSACVATTSRERLLLSDKTLRLIVNPVLADARYVCICLSSHRVRRQIVNAASGSSLSMQNISQSAVEGLSFHWPSLAQQQKIVEVVDAVSRQEQVIAASVAKLSAMKSAAADDLLKGMAWDCILSDAANGPIRNGYSPVESEAWTGVRMLGLGCLTPAGFDPVQLKNAPSLITRNHAAILRDGDLLMSRANTRELVGLAGIYRDVGTPCIYPDLMMRIRPSNRCSAEFLAAVLMSARVRRHVRALAQGTSESMVKISAATVREIPVPLPTSEEQDRLLGVLNSFSAQIRDKNAELAKLSKLKQGIVDDLLSGRVGV